MAKRGGSYTLSPQGLEGLALLAAFYGISRSNVLEILIRQELRNKGLVSEEATAPQEETPKPPE